MGHLRKRGTNLYEIVVDLPPDPLGKRKRPQKSETFHGSKRDAERRMRALEGEIDRGAHQASDTTVRDLLTRWMAHVSPDLAAGTVRTYQGYIDNRILPALGDIRIRKLSNEGLDEFYAALRADGLAPASVRHVHAILRRALRQAVKWHMIEVNPALVAEPGRVPQIEIHPPPPEDVAKLRAVARAMHPSLGTFLFLKSRIGARRGEMCGLRWGDIDWDLPEIVVARSIALVPGGVLEKDTKTHRIRHVSLDDETVDELRRHRWRVEAEAVKAKVELEPDGYVFSFCAAGCHPWRPDSAGRLFRKAREKAKVKGRLHDLRHYMATQWLDAGVPITVVSNRLGHANPRTTLGVYAHAVKSTDQAAAQEMGERLSKKETNEPDA